MKKLNSQQKDILKEQLNIVPKTLFFKHFVIQENCNSLDISEGDVILNHCENVLEYLCKQSNHFVDMDAFLKSFKFIYKDEILYSVDNIGVLNNKIVIILTIRSTTSPSFSDGEGAGGEANGVQLPHYKS